MPTEKATKHSAYGRGAVLGVLAVFAGCVLPGRGVSVRGAGSSHDFDIPADVCSTEKVNALNTTFYGTKNAIRMKRGEFEAKCKSLQGTLTNGRKAKCRCPQNSLLVLDFDDTILPTTQLEAERGYSVVNFKTNFWATYKKDGKGKQLYVPDICPTTKARNSMVLPEKQYGKEQEYLPYDEKAQMTKLCQPADDAASDLLKKAFKLGYKVLLLTNGHGRWIKRVAKDGLMPKFFKLMRSNGGVVISTWDHAKNDKISTIDQLSVSNNQGELVTEASRLWGQRLGYGNNTIIKVVGAGDKAWDLTAAKTLAAKIGVPKENVSTMKFRESSIATATTLQKNLLELKELL